MLCLLLFMQAASLAKLALLVDNSQQLSGAFPIGPEYFEVKGFIVFCIFLSFINFVRVLSDVFHSTC